MPRSRIASLPLLALTLISAPSSSRADDWPGFLGPQRNGHSRETGLATTFPDSGPKVLWKTPLGSGFSGLSVAGGKVFTLYGKDGKELVAAFSTKDGKQAWKLPLGDDFAQGRSYGPRSTPTVDGNRLFAVSALGQVLCLDAATGKKIWSFNIYDDYGMPPHEEGLSPSPLLVGGRLILPAGRHLFAFDVKSGKLIWKSLEENMNHVSPIVAKFDGKDQLLLLTGQNLVGLDLEKGSELWRHESQGVNIANPVPGPGNIVYTAASYGFGSQAVALRGKTPRQLYKNEVLASHVATPILVDGHLYGFHDRVGIFKCMELATGEEKWESREVPKGNLIAADGHLFIITEEGELVIGTPSPEGFETTARAHVLKGTCYTAPSLSGNRLYLRSNEEMLCIDLAK